MILSIAVCGAGTMGRGIAQVCAMHGFNTVLFDVQPEMLKEAEKQIAASLQKLTEKNKLSTNQLQHIRQQLRFTSEQDACSADLVIEAIVEQLQPKVELFKQLIELNRPDTIFASNTSSLSVTKIAEQTGRPENVIGMHFFNPATIMQLVEVVQTHYTSQALMEVVVALVSQLGKTPVRCQDAPGFIVNRVARPYYLEALHLLEMGVADMETIDALLEATGFRMGPFRLMDLIGNDVNYAVSCSLYEALQQPARLKPSGIQQQKVEKGELGRKTGKGYYDYK